MFLFLGTSDSRKKCLVVVVAFMEQWREIAEEEITFEKMREWEEKVEGERQREGENENEKWMQKERMNAYSLLQ